MFFCPSGFSLWTMIPHSPHTSTVSVEQMPEIITFRKIKKVVLAHSFVGSDPRPPCFGHVVRQPADDRSQLFPWQPESNREKKASVLLTSLQEKHPPGPAFPKFYCLSTPPSTLGTRFVDNVQTVSWIHTIPLNSRLIIHSVLLSMESIENPSFPLISVWVFCLWHNSLVIPQIFSYFI